MTDARISDQNNYVLFTIFNLYAMQKLAPEKIIAGKVFKYLISSDYNCKKAKIDLRFYYVYHKLLLHCPISLDTKLSQELPISIIYLP